ncbi:MAG: CRISPR system precrRNA processing endoribonuclease RAMP protein Cas6 [Nitrososphaerales archaeon]
MSVRLDMPIERYTFTVATDEPIEFQSYSGFAVRGLFFDLLKRVSKDKAEELHVKKRLAPYSTTPVEVLSPAGSVEIIYKGLPKGVSKFSITLLDSDLSNIFKELLCRNELTNLSLKGRECRLISLEYSRLNATKLVDEARAVDKFAVRFRSPTYFRRTPVDVQRIFPTARKSDCAQPDLYRSHPLPDPVLMFRSLLRLWRAFSEASTKIPLNDFKEWVEIGGVVLSGYPRAIRTFRVYEHPTSNKWIVGFVGEVHFSLPKDLYSEKYAKVVDALLRYGEYTNVGGGRSAGLGVIEYLEADADSLEA